MRLFCVYCAANKNQLGNVREAGAPTQTQFSAEISEQHAILLGINDGS